MAAQPPPPAPSNVPVGPPQPVNPPPASTPQQKANQGAPAKQAKKGTPSTKPQSGKPVPKKAPAKKKGGYWSTLDRNELRRMKIYLFSIQIAILIIIIINATYESLILDFKKVYLSAGFYFPIGYILLLVLLLFFMLSTEGLWFKFIQIRNAKSFSKREKLIKNYHSRAQSVLVFAIVVIIILLSLNFLPIFSESLRTEKNYEVTANEEDVRFEAQDALGLTHTKSITVNSNDTVHLELDTKELTRDLNQTEIKYEDLGFYTNKEIPLSASEYQFGYSTNKKYYFFINNIGNQSVSGKYTINREISKSFILNILLFMFLFMITSIIWLAYLSVTRKKFEHLHEQKSKELTRRFAIKQYTIEDVFLIYHDGVLITHETRRLKPMDNDILSSMLTAIKDFTLEAFSSETSDQLNELKFGKLNILIESGQLAYIAVVINGEPPKELRTKLKQVVAQINRDYYHQLKNFTGVISDLSGAKTIIETQLLKAKDPEFDFNDTSESAWNNRGVAFTKLKKYHDAILCFDNALKINPRVSDIWLNRGIALVKLNEFDEAMDCFDRAVQLDPNNNSAKRRRNKCWYKWKLIEGRERHLSRAAGQPMPRGMEPLPGPGLGPGPAPAPVDYYDAPLGGPVDDGYGAPPVLEEEPPRCPNCGQPLNFVEVYESWYCEPCDLYPYDD